jgi:hypothetical protein
VSLAGGGAQSGSGGFVETSSKGQLNFAGQVDTKAPNGTAGTLLLDPADYYIVAPGVTVPVGASSITPAALQTQLASNSVVISTDSTTNPLGQNGDIFVNAPISWSSSNSLTVSALRDINVNAPISWSSGGSLILSALRDVSVDAPISWNSGGSLILSAFRDINVNASITNTGGAAVVLQADNTGTGLGTVSFGDLSAARTAAVSSSVPGAGNSGIGFAQGGTCVSTSGPVSIFYNPSPSEGSKYQNATDYSKFVTAPLTAYMLVNAFSDLQAVSTNLSGAYALGTDITAGKHGADRHVCRYSERAEPYHQQCGDRRGKLCDRRQR